MADVVVVGSFMMDLVVRGPRRPERGETVIGTSFETFLGGKGFNQAIAAARAGASTAMVGRIGDDDFGRRFLAQLEADGIDASGVGVDPDIGTGVGLPFVEDSGDNSIVVVPRANHALTAAQVRDAAALIEAAKVLLLQMELPLDATVEAAYLAKHAGVTVVLNPAPAVLPLDELAGLVDYITPNESEAQRLGAIDGVVITTLGEGGVDVAGERIDAHKVECVDTVGAGDAFCGAFAALLAEGASFVDAARFGNAAGALAVGIPGAEPSMPTRDAIERLLGF
jgi:ribokinase